MKGKDYFAGIDCKCGVWSSNECGCDADWTDPVVYELRAKIRQIEALINLSGSNSDSILEALSICKYATKNL